MEPRGESLPRAVVRARGGLTAVRHGAWRAAKALLAALAISVVGVAVVRVCTNSGRYAAERLRAQWENARFECWEQGGTATSAWKDGLSGNGGYRFFCWADSRLLYARRIPYDE